MEKEHIKYFRLADDQENANYKMRIQFVPIKSEKLKCAVIFKFNENIRKFILSYIYQSSCELKYLEKYTEMKTQASEYMCASNVYSSKNRKFLPTEGILDM